ncbi:MAG TPA: hypothetical protein PKE14_13900, partial [Chitinophagales bacterium]|nr:hypothetical protein [Chitinophagales bacterium]
KKQSSTYMAESNNWINTTLQEVVSLGELEVSESRLTVKNEDDARTLLIEMIAFLIDHNFEKLLFILYRIDIDEQKVKLLLSKHLPDEAPVVIADLIIERQKQKEAFKASFEHTPPEAMDEDLLL